MASIGISLNNFFFSVNSLRWVHGEAYQRRSLAPVRYAAENGYRMVEKEVIYSDNKFRLFLVSILAILLAINIYSFICGVWVTLFAIIFQGSILFSIYKKHPVQIILIKIWVGIIFLIGVLEFIQVSATLLRNYLNDNVALNDGLNITDILIIALATIPSTYIYFELPNKTAIIKKDVS